MGVYPMYINWVRGEFTYAWYVTKMENSFESSYSTLSDYWSALQLQAFIITSFLGPDSEVIYTFTILNLDKKPYESRPFTTMKCIIIISFDDPGFTHIAVY